MSTHVPRAGARRNTLLAAALFAGCILSSHLSAQSCSNPIVLLLDMSIGIDTCGSAPATVCGGFPAGPAAVFPVQLRYPRGAWTFEVVPEIGSNFDPVIIVQRPQCGTGACPFVIDNAGVGGGEVFNLDLDSGFYYLLVTSFDPDHSCGKALVLLQEESGGPNDGIFRSRFDY